MLRCAPLCSERRLFAVELMCTLLHLAARAGYPAAELHDIWKTVLLNQVWLAWFMVRMGGGGGGGGGVVGEPHWLALAAMRNGQVLRAPTTHPHLGCSDTGGHAGVPVPRHSARLQHRCSLRRHARRSRALPAYIDGARRTYPKQPR